VNIADDLSDDEDEIIELADVAGHELGEDDDLTSLLKIGDAKANEPETTAEDDYDALADLLKIGDETAEGETKDVAIDDSDIQAPQDKEKSAGDIDDTRENDILIIADVTREALKEKDADEDIIGLFDDIDEESPQEEKLTRLTDVVDELAYETTVDSTEADKEITLYDEENAFDSAELAEMSYEDPTSRTPESVQDTDLTETESAKSTVSTALPEDEPDSTQAVKANQTDTGEKDEITFLSKTEESDDRELLLDLTDISPAESDTENDERIDQTEPASLSQNRRKTALTAETEQEIVIDTFEFVDKKSMHDDELDNLAEIEEVSKPQADSETPVVIPSEQAIPSEQMEDMLERVILKLFSGKIETMLGNVIETAVNKEIQRLKNVLLKDITDD
jgi:hypothetical protein